MGRRLSFIEGVVVVGAGIAAAAVVVLVYLAYASAHRGDQLEEVITLLRAICRALHARC